MSVGIAEFGNVAIRLEHEKCVELWEVVTRCLPVSSHFRPIQISKLEARGKGSSTPSIIKSDTGKGESVAGKDSFSG